MASYDSILETVAIRVIVDDAGSKQTLTRIKQDTERAYTAVARQQKRRAELSREEALALDKVSDETKRLSRFADTLRKQYENNVISQDEFVRKSNELRRSLLKQAEGLDETSAEYNKLQLGAQRVSTALATVEGRTSKLGISANVATGTAEGYRRALDRLGPAGRAAGDALGFAEGAVKSFQSPLDLSRKGLAKFTASLRTVTVVAPLFAAAVTGVAAAALVRLTNRASEAADAIDKGSQSAGLSVEAYQELRFAFQQSGINAERFDLAVQSLNRRLGLAAQGNATYADAYARLGIEIRDANGQVRDAEDVLTDAITVLSQYESSAEAAAEASIIFGDDVGKKLTPIINQGAEGLANLREQARELGLVVSGDAVLSLVEYRDEVAVLRQQFETAGVEIAASFLPLLRDVVVPFIQDTLVPQVQGATTAVGTWVEKLRDADELSLSNLATEITNVIGPVLQLTAVFGGLFAGATAAINGILAEVARFGAVVGAISTDPGMFARGRGTAMQLDLMGLSPERAAELGIIDSGDQDALAFTDFINNLGEEAAQPFRDTRQAALEWGDDFTALFLDPSGPIQTALVEAQRLLQNPPDATRTNAGLTNPTDTDTNDNANGSTATPVFTDQGREGIAPAFNPEVFARIFAAALKNELFNDTGVEGVAPAFDATVFARAFAGALRDQAFVDTGVEGIAPPFVADVFARQFDAAFRDRTLVDTGAEGVAPAFNEQVFRNAFEGALRSQAFVDTGVEGVAPAFDAAVFQRLFDAAVRNSALVDTGAEGVAPAFNADAFANAFAGALRRFSFDDTGVEGVAPAFNAEVFAREFAAALNAQAFTDTGSEGIAPAFDATVFERQFQGALEQMAFVDTGAEGVAPAFDAEVFNRQFESAGERFSDEARQSGLAFATTVVNAGQTFSSAIESFRRGDVGGGITGLGNVASSIATLIPGGAAIAPLISAGASLLGGLFSLGQNDSGDSPAANSAQSRRNLSQLELNFTFNQSNSLGLLDDPTTTRKLEENAESAFRRFEDIIKRNINPRLDALEARI